jgi:hypothetical protein
MAHFGLENTLLEPQWEQRQSSTSNTPWTTTLALNNTALSALSVVFSLTDY